LERIGRNQWNLSITLTCYAMSQRTRNKEIKSMKWYLPEKKLPPQGLKILCMHKGDFYVAQRFRDYWFQIPFIDSKYSSHQVPQKWCHIDFPDHYQGYIHFMYREENRSMTADELDAEHPDLLTDIINAILEGSSKGKNGL
jgi:hypothetical protein